LPWPLEDFIVFELNLAVCEEGLEDNDEGASKRSKNLRELQDRAASWANFCDLHESAA